MKIHKNCCHQSCSFWPRYAQNPLSAPSAPPDPLAGLRGLLLREWEGTGRGGEGEEGRGGDETPPLHAPLIHVSGYAPDFGANNRPTKFQRSASSTFAALSC